MQYNLIKLHCTLFNLYGGDNDLIFFILNLSPSLFFSHIKLKSKPARRKQLYLTRTLFIYTIKVNEDFQLFHIKSYSLMFIIADSFFFTKHLIIKKSWIILLLTKMIYKTYNHVHNINLHIQ